MRILDLDLDFFQNRVATRRGEPRQESGRFHPWEQADVQQFLEDRCLLNRERPLPGRSVELHHEALRYWRKLIDDGRLETPFEVVHVDGHADLGLGDSGYVYVMEDLVHRSLDGRFKILEGDSGLNEGNYLLFALAFRWLSRLEYVSLEEKPDDLLAYAFQDNDPNTRQLQLYPATNITSGEQRIPTDEPAVPFSLTHWPAFQALTPFDYVLLSKSQQYTAVETDDLVPLIQQYLTLE